MHDMTKEQIKRLIEDENYMFYSHCLIEAKKDGVRVEDIIYCLLTGEIIEKYPDRKRALVYSVLINSMPLHVVVDLKQKDILKIITCYIPDDREWIKYKKRKR